MAVYDVTVMLTVQRSACIQVRARTAEQAEEKMQQRLEAGTPWETLTKGCDIDEVEFSYSIADVSEA